MWIIRFNVYFGYIKCNIIEKWRKISNLSWSVEINRCFRSAIECNKTIRSSDSIYFESILGKNWCSVINIIPIIPYWWCIQNKTSVWQISNILHYNIDSLIYCIGKISLHSLITSRVRIVIINLPYLQCDFFGLLSEFYWFIFGRSLKNWFHFCKNCNKIFRKP